MSRGLKFRAWSLGNRLKGTKPHYIDDFAIDAVYGTPRDIFDGNKSDDGIECIEQYTGLRDKNGKEIYEGDIVKFDCGDQTPAEVVYQDGSYFLKALDDGTLFYDPDADKPCPLGWLKTYGLEVIGNIHENTELLEERSEDEQTN